MGQEFDTPKYGGRDADRQTLLAAFYDRLAANSIPTGHPQRETVCAAAHELALRAVREHRRRQRSSR